MIADGKNTYLMAGLNSDIVDCWKACYEQFKEQPRRLVARIQGRGSIEERCESVFDYMVKHSRYKLDKDGEQLIKSPARFLNDECGDCKSYTMFLACCLHCLGIPCIVRFVNFDGGDQWTHVYAVGIDENGNEIIMDACEKDRDGVILFGYAREYAKKKDIIYY